MKDAGGNNFGVLGTEGHMHSWCENIEAARAAHYHCAIMYPGSEIVRIEEDSEASADEPDYSVTYEAE